MHMNGSDPTARLAFDNQDKIAETLLFALNFRAVEARQPNPLLLDHHAVRLVEQIDYDFSRFKLNPIDHVCAIMRVRQFDNLTRDFLSRYPPARVIHIGCGLDTRFERVDNGQVEWYDLDLPEVIDLRKKLILPKERCQMIGCSVLEPGWIPQVRGSSATAYLFVSEGVFPYFTPQQVRQLFLLLSDNFPGCELVCDGTSPFMIKLHNLELVASKVGARLHWGLKNGKEPEGWGKGIRLLSEWFYFDQPEPRLGAFQLMRYLPFFARGVGVYHYRLGTGER